MPSENTLNKIISWTCIIGGALLFFLFLGDLIVRLLGAAAALWLILYGINLQGISTRSFYINIKSRFRR